MEEISPIVGLGFGIGEKEMEKKWMISMETGFLTGYVGLKVLHGLSIL